MAKNNKKKAQKMAKKGKSASQIKAKTGVGSKTAQSFVAKYSPSPSRSTPAPSRPAPSRPAPVPKISNKNSVGKNLRAASGANNVLSNKELLKISKKNDKNPEKILEKAVGKGMLIGSKVVNKYQKGAYTDPRTAFWRGLSPNLSLATGMDSPILNQLRNAGKQDKGSALFIGSKGSTSTTLPRKIGTGNTYRPPGTPPPGDPPPQDPPPGDDPPVIEGFPQVPLPVEEEEEMDPGVGMMSGGGMGAAGANKLGRAKSRLRKLGIYGRGTGLFGRGLQYGNALNA